MNTLEETPIFVVFVCTDSTPNELNVKIDPSSPLMEKKVVAA